MRDHREHPPFELDVFVPVQMPEEFVLWAVEYLGTKSTKPISKADIYALFQAVCTAMMAGKTFPGTREQSYEYAYATYCEAVEAICQRRGHARHRHRHLPTANDD